MGSYVLCSSRVSRQLRSVEQCRCRFFGDFTGAWYSAWNVVASVSEVAFHRTRQLSYTGCFEDCAQCVELLADFIGVFDDIFDEPVHPALHPESEIGYSERESLAQHVRRGGSRGLIYPLVWAPEPGGNCLVCFEPRAIQNVRPGASWDLIWDGTLEYSIRAVG